jgi:hypothetical protein
VLSEVQPSLAKLVLALLSVLVKIGAFQVCPRAASAGSSFLYIRDAPGKEIVE